MLGLFRRDADDFSILEQRAPGFALRTMQDTPHDAFDLHGLMLGFCFASIRFPVPVVLLGRPTVDDPLAVNRFDRDGCDHVAAAWTHTANLDLRSFARTDG